MQSRLLRHAVPLTVLSAALISCTSDAPNPVGVETVRLAVIANADQGGKPFSLDMTQEVTTTPVYAGDADGTGTAVLTVNHGQQTACWELTVNNVTLPATAAHIHKAAVNVRGPIVIGLSAPDATGVASGCRNNVDRDLLRDILNNPAVYYVNVHTPDYPAGAVRAQLHH
jgi:hypothetical protein